MKNLIKTQEKYKRKEKVNIIDTEARQGGISSIYKKLVTQWYQAKLSFGCSDVSIEVMR